jgi:intein/homing endonuclease
MTRLEGVLGSGGTGKSFTINNRIKDNVSYGIRTATTGIAALNMGSIYGAEEPTTINKALNYFSVESLLSKYTKGKMLFPLKNINRKYQNIIIDEVSMLNAATLDLIVKSIKDYNKITNNDLGLIVSGDAGQLPPVQGAPFFMAKCWPEFNVTNLTEVKRQENVEFIKALNYIRRGEVLNAVDWFSSNIKFINEPNIYFRGTTLFAINNEVNIFNKRKLKLLQGESKIYNAVVEGEEHITWSNIDRSIELKKGAVIQLLYNDFNYGFANGDLAIIDDMWDKCIYISLLRKNKQICLRPRKIQHFNMTSKGYLEKKPLGTLQLFHIKLAAGQTFHKCVSENSLVITPTSLKKIKDVKVGEYICTGQGFYSPVLNKWQSEKKNKYKINLRQGYNLELSSDHKLLSWGNNSFEYKSLQNLNVGDYICVDRRVQYFKNTSNLLDIESAWVLGALIGDGFYKGSKKAINHITFCNQDINCLNKMKTYLNKFSFKYSCKNKRANKNVYVIDACNKNFRQHLLNLGLTRVSKKEKDVPLSIFSSSVEIRGSFLQGLFDTDGHCNKNLNYVSISKNLIYNVQILLNTLGIISYINIEKNAYKLHITPSSFDNFIKFIGFSVESKQQNLLELYKNASCKANIDCLPISLKRYILDDLNKQLKNPSIYTIDINIYNVLSRKKSRISYYMFNRIMDFYKLHNLCIPDLCNKILDNNYFFSEISSITLDCKENLYDIEVKDYHTFWCNGIVSHNCQGLTLDDLQVNLKGAGNNFIRRTSGMLYTALSRVRTPEGLVIVGTPQDLINSCYVDPLYKKLIF